MKKRNNIDISADILKVATVAANKTRLVYGANLNFSIIRRYLENLTDKGLIEAENGVFHTTEKGREFLRKYDSLISPFRHDRRIVNFER